MANNFAIELIVNGFNKLNELVDNLEIAETKQKAFNKLVAGTKIDRIQDLTTTFKEAGGITGMVKGAISAVQGLGTSILGLLPPISAVGAALTATGIILVVLAIVAVIAVAILAWKMMKRAIDLNIGGIKGSFLKAMAKLRLAVAKLQIRFDKLLKKMAPGFKILGVIIGWVADKIVTGIVAAFDFLLPVMSFIINRFNAMLAVVGMIVERLGGTTKVMKIIGVMAKILFLPMIIAAKAIATIFKVIYEVIKAMFEIMDKMENWGLSKILGIDAKEIEKAKAGIGNNNSTQNNLTNNNNITFNAQSKLGPETAPQFANMFANAVGRQQQVGL